MKRYLVLFFIHSFALVLFAQIPVGYYNSVDGKSNNDLKIALYNAIKDHTNIGYDGLLEAYKTTDVLNGGIWDMYSDCDFSFGGKCGNYKSVCDCYNREHSFPKSWFGDKSPMKSDIFHVYPTDGKVNGMRSNYPFGEVGSSYTPWGTAKLGTARSDLGYNGTVFEPADEYKGDFARSYFYMITRYQNLVSTWSSDMLSGNGFTTWATNMLLEWHRNDPVSEKEINRNNEVYLNYQHNRNPFIDYPELTEYIWGDMKGQVWNMGEDIPRIILPLNNAVLDFGTIAYQSSKNMTLQIKGINLTDDLNVTVTGADAALFSVSQQIILQEEAQNGCSITVSFNAENTGTMNATLQISGGGAATVSVALKVISSDDFIALPATYLSSIGFTANWTASANATGYILDVYFIHESGGSVPQVYLEETFESGLPSNWTSTGYTGKEDNMIRLASGSQNGSITTPTINFGNETTIFTVQAQQYSNDNEAALTVTLNGSNAAIWQTTSEMKEYTVNLPPVESGKITLSAQSGKRVYVNFVEVASKGSEIEKISITSYPKLVGNVLSYAVTDLESDSTYYYSVTPEGNGEAESNEIMIRTLKEEEVFLPETDAVSTYWIVNNNLLYIYNLPQNCSLRLIDISGKQIIFAQDTSFEVQIPLPQRGVYILQVVNEGKSETIKILY